MLHQSELDGHFLSQDCRSPRALYALQSFYGCPMIVEIVPLLFEYLFYYEFYREKILLTVAVKSPVKRLSSVEALNMP